MNSNLLNIAHNTFKPGDTAPVPPNAPDATDIMARWKDNNDMPLLSIICHAYNHGNYIHHALNSFLMQETNFPFEIIVHDDASTDKTRNIIEHYAAQYPDIIKPIFQTENQFSKGNKPPRFSFPAAKGKYLSFCEGDDYWLDKCKLQKQVDFLETHPEYSVCGHDAIIIEGNTVTGTSKLPKAFQRDCASHKLRKGFFILTLSATFVNKVSEYAPEQTNFINGDLLLFSRLGLHGHYKFMPDIEPGVYRAHAGGVWSLLDQEKKKSTQINSFFWISLYHKRNNNPELTDEYAYKAAQLALTNTANFSLGFILKFFFRLLRAYAVTIKIRLFNKP